MRIETNSSMLCFMECPEKYKLRYIERLSTKSYRSALGLGTFVHAFAEEKHSGKTQIPPMALARELDRHDEQYHEEIRNDFDLAKSISLHWIDYWNKDTTSLSNNNIKFVFTEHEWKFKHSLAEMAGKSDGVVEHSGGKLYLYELKTAALRDKDNYIHQLQLDSQISGNIVGLIHNGVNVSGVIYDIIWKPALIRKTDRKTMPDETVAEYNARIVEAIKSDPSRFFERLLVVRNDKSLEDYLEQTKRRSISLLSMEDRDSWYKNTGACKKFGSLCEFHEFCIEGIEEAKQFLNKRDMKHPELTLEVQLENQ